MFPKIVVLLIHYIILCENEKLAFAEPIVGHGIRDAKEKEFPFIVSIGIAGKFSYADEKHLCTGTLISRWHVLTAAHCLDDLKRRKVQVTIGSVDLRKGRAFYSDKWVTYDQWYQRKWVFAAPGVHDLAIIKLTEEVNESSIEPAKVWRGKNEELYHKTATVAGWGHTNDVEDTSRILQTALVKMPSNIECSRSKDSCSAKPNHLQIHTRFLCSKAKPYVLLDCGDSGGPLIYGNNTIIGINRGLCPTNDGLDRTLPLEVIKRNRINLHTSTTWYQSFIDDCLANF